MPTNYLKRLNKDYKIPMKKLEEYWKKAQDIAKKSGREDQFAYVTGIFKNMLALSSTSAYWWDMLDREQQLAYLEEHPNSDLKPKSSEDDSENEEESNEPKHNLKRKLHGLWSRRRAEAVGSLRHHKRGLGLLSSFLRGGTLTDNEYERAKKTATVTAALLLTAFVGVALFTPLVPFAAQLALEFLNSKSGGDLEVDASEYSESGEDLAGKVLDDMYNWLLDQDIPKLVEKFKSEAV